VLEASLLFCYQHVFFFSFLEVPPSCDFKCFIEDAQTLLSTDGTISIEYVILVTCQHPPEPKDETMPTSVERSVETHQPITIAKRTLLRKFDHFKVLENSLISNMNKNSENSGIVKKISRDSFTVFGSTKLNPNSAFVTMRKKHLQQFCDDVVSIYDQCSASTKELIDTFFELQTIRCDISERRETPGPVSGVFERVPRCEECIPQVVLDWFSLDGCMKWRGTSESIQPTITE